MLKNKKKVAKEDYLKKALDKIINRPYDDMFKKKVKGKL
jgi:hypothetical protein